MSSFTAVVTSHANDKGLRNMLGQLLYQTRKPDEIIVYVSEPQDYEALLRDFEGYARFVPVPNMEDFGHEKRAQGLMEAASDYVGWFNDDDTYEPDYIEKMMAVAEAGAGAVYCAWNTIPHCSFRLGNSTSGNFIVRTDIGRQAGYKSRQYVADGHFIDEIARLTPAVKVEEILYYHNVQ